MAITVEFTGKQGKVDVPNVVGMGWEVSRNPAPNGQIGQRNHNIGCITLVRQKSLMKGGKVTNETALVKLAAGVEEKGYFGGSIVVTSQDNSGATIQTIRWDQGHICDFKTGWSDHGMQETMSIAVTGLKVDDSEFKVEFTT
jgi:hypothetical protein